MYNKFFELDEKIIKAAESAEEKTREVYAEIDKIGEYNTYKVLKAFSDKRVSESYFVGTTGYGYGDRGRDMLDEVFAQIVGAEDAIIRHSFASGTHAISTMLFGILRPNDKMVCLTGTPYDTLHGVIGLTDVVGKGSLKDFGIKYGELPLLADSTVDFDGIPKAIKGAKMAYIQRSRGYELRPSLTVEIIAEMIKRIREVDKEIVIAVDNCYGEFVERIEPTEVGADLIVGSLIKNPGGGIAKTGGYIAGRKDLVELCACRLTTASTGKEIGCSLGETRNMYMGLFAAPTVVSAALKTAVLTASMFKDFGFEVTPEPTEQRADIIQAVKLVNEERLVAFCQGIQKGAPIDSFVTPEPWDMPGYDSKVIMAAGAFTGGASIELSADAPLREPYAAWLQGGLNYPSGKIGVMLAAQSMLEKNLLNLK
ncbi:MAG: methionine gamma-lyase family protein [Oscillospiraceae bacterium]